MRPKMDWILNKEELVKAEILTNDKSASDKKNLLKKNPGPDEKLFLRADKTCPGNRLDQAQILTLNQQTVAFKDICEHNAEGNMCQLLWMPPTVPAYSVSEDSIFDEHKNYSKLLVFDEHRFLQRGGPVLLSQYADAVNRKSAADSPYAEYLSKLQLPFEQDDVDITTLAGWEIPEQSSLDDIQTLWLKGEQPRTNNTLIALAALADPAVCVMRLWKELGDAKTIAKAFKAYLLKEHSQLALCAWMAEKKIPHSQEDVNLAVLQYCAEGNLLAVFREWFSVGKFSDTKTRCAEVCECLLRTKSKVKVYVQTKDNYLKQGVGQAGILCSCGFAEQLTSDHLDVGTKTGSKAENAHDGIMDAFNSPFWPMVLFVGRGAQEGLDFHNYCLRIMHLTLPRGAVSFDQRQGRIDRFRSLLVRRRAAEVIGIGCSPRIDLEDAVFQTMERWAKQSASPDVWKKDQIFPYWQIKEEPGWYESAHHFERMIPVLNYTDDMIEYQQLSAQLRSYRSTIGSADVPLPDEYRHLQIDLTAKSS